jgi:hypothetical protein
MGDGKKLVGGVVLCVLAALGSIGKGLEHVKLGGVGREADAVRATEQGGRWSPALLRGAAAGRVDHKLEVACSFPFQNATAWTYSIVIQDDSKRGTGFDFKTNIPKDAKATDQVKFDYSVTLNGGPTLLTLSSDLMFMTSGQDSKTKKPFSIVFDREDGAAKLTWLDRIYDGSCWPTTPGKTLQ